MRPRPPPDQLSIFAAKVEGRELGAPASMLARKFCTRPGDEIFGIDQFFHEGSPARVGYITSRRRRRAGSDVQARPAPGGIVTKVL